MLTPDGHAWCYYYGRGLPGGASDSGDPWAGAFDRVVGKAVTYMPLWQEVYLGEYDAYFNGSGSADAGSAPTSYYLTYQWGLTSSSYLGVVPIYGAPSQYSATNATIGGSKCAPPRPSSSGANDATGYYQAWYSSDCKEGTSGDSDLQVYTGPGGYIGGGACFVQTVSGSPGYNKGYRRMQIGLSLVADGAGPVGNAFYNYRALYGGYPQFGCQPGAGSGSVNQGAQLVNPPSDTGGNGG